MRHRLFKRTVRRKNSYEKSMYLNLVKSLICFGYIITTLARAKKLISVIMRLKFKIFKNNSNFVTDKRFLLSFFKDIKAVYYFFKCFGSKHKNERKNVKLIRCGFRRGDSAPIALVKLF